MKEVAAWINDNYKEAQKRSIDEQLDVMTTEEENIWLTVALEVAEEKASAYKYSVIAAGIALTTIYIFEKIMSRAFF